MKSLFKYCHCWLLIFIFVLGACASSSRYQVKRPFLYEVSKGSQKGFLFGTIHMGVTAKDLPNSFWPYFDQSDSVTLEADLEKANDYAREIRARLVRKKTEPSLQQQLSPSDYLKLTQILQREMPKQSSVLLEQASPYGAFVVLTSLIAKKQNVQIESGNAARSDSQNILDQGLFERARQQQKTIGFLDSAENVSSLVACVANRKSVYLQSIHELLEKPEIVHDKVQNLQNLIVVYREGNSQELQKYFKDLPQEMDDCLIVERNKQWLPLILSNLEAYQQPFFAVGAAHLESEKASLLQLLKDNGFEIRRVSFPNE